MRKVCGLVAVCALLVTGAASAQAGMYVGGNVGATAGTDSDISFTADLAGQAPIVGEGETSWDNGYWVSGFIGYGFDVFPVRLESEIFYQADDADESTAFGVTGEARGERSSYGALVNVYFDFENATKFTPFIGGGLGAAKVDISDVTDNFKSSSDVVFAYQIGAGVAMRITDSVSVDLKYRYYGTSDISDTVADSFDSGDFLTQDIENGMHNILFGVRVEL